VTKGDLSQSINVEAAGEVAALKDNINEMIVNLRETTEKNTAQDWLKTNLAKFTRLLQGQRDLTTVSRTILSELAPLVPMQHGVIYFNEAPDGGDADLRLLASYAYTESDQLRPRFKAGESLVGQAAVEKEPILLTDVPPNYVRISSGLGAAAPTNIFVIPVLFEGQVKAVIELASFYRFNETHLNFLGQLTESIGIVLNTITATMRTEELLKQSQSLATELQKTNEELEEKAELLAKQNAEVEQKNREIDQARLSLEDKAAQLALTSRYKSEFLANMSHELRTPLNSLLILSRLLAQNSEGTLTEKQVEFAKTIHASGSDLLELINEILDLSKIESGMMDVDAVSVSLADVQSYVDRTFREVAGSKGLTFAVELDPHSIGSVITDQKRVQQVLKNLLSNAIKFTEQGSVTLSIEPATGGWTPGNSSLDRAASVVAFRVTDTGIGISTDKHQVIFEAFQQADGTTSRKYGGTGLGLSISREIAKLLGGEIRLSSSVGKGSTFTLFLPSVYASTLTPLEREVPVEARLAVNREIEADDIGIDDNPLSDDRQRIQPGDRVLLVIENDHAFARILMDLGREYDFRVLGAVRGDVGLRMARQHRPDAITLDLDLPGLDGWNVLDRLKHDASTRHIPVHVISVTDDPHRGMRLGAKTFWAKPSERATLDQAFDAIKEFNDRKLRTLLIVEDDDVQRSTLVELIGDRDVEITAVGTGREALGQLAAKPFDCIVLDLGLHDMSGLQLLEMMRADQAMSQVPVIIYTGKELSKAEETALRQLAQTIIIKDVKSPERLLDETTLFLHRVESALPPEKQRLLDQLHRSDPQLAGKKALIVDDDIRNIFALTSILERYEMDVQYAENGHDALKLLNNHPDVDVVLMDVMMPEMDGYEATRRIRENETFEDLPIIAITAKAMKGDREKCINAGASDYVTKPVDSDQLISLLRVWLSR